MEHLRTDVVKGLGVKLLDKVLDIMQEEDEDKREASQPSRRVLGISFLPKLDDVSDLAHQI